MSSSKKTPARLTQETVARIAKHGAYGQSEACALAEELERSQEALKRISAMCNVGTNQCVRCGRTTGVLAVKSCADKALLPTESAEGDDE